MKLLTLRQSSALLASCLHGNEKKWYGFLLKNCRIKNGYKITSHVRDGKLHFTREALMQYVSVSTTSQVQVQNDLEWEIVNESVYDFFDCPDEHDFNLSDQQDQEEVASIVLEHLGTIMSKHYGVSKPRFSENKVIEMINLYLDRRSELYDENNTN